MHIRAYLFLMAAGILVPVIGFSGLALGMLQDAEKTAALRALSEMANGVVLRVDRELYSAEAGLKVLAASPSLARRDFPAFYREAKVTNSGSTGWNALVDRQGQQLTNTYLPFGGALPASGTPLQVAAMLAANRISVSDLQPGPLSGRKVTTVDLPLTQPDGTGYVISRVFAAAHFNQLIANTKVPPGWIVALIDGKGKFIARNHNSDNLIGKPARPELVAAIRANKSGRIRHKTLEGVEVDDVFISSSMSGWAVAVAAPVELIERSARQASMVAAMGLLAALAAAIAMAAFFGRLHVRSIARAVKAASELGKGIPPGPTHSRVVEVNELHAALHAAGEQLLQSQAYRRQAEAERQALLESEQKARVMAEQQNRAKDQFLAMLGHELRNPLAPISTAAQLLKMAPGDASRVRYASDVISRQVEHMNSLLGDMLDVARVTRGLVGLSIERVSLKAVVERALEQTHSLVELKQHQVSVDMADSGLEIDGDKTRLIQIFANLIGNAAKYTPAGGKVRVSAHGAGPNVIVTVRDNGEGIADELLPRIFELFSQGERAPDRAEGGLGLGLALVRSLVHLHGGSVVAESRGQGQGSTFTVTLPRESGAGKAQVEAPDAAGAAAPLRVMIVDDNTDGAISLSLLLKEAGGHSVSTYYDAGSALEWAASQAPQVFILDIGLPDMTGYELARRLRAMPELASATFIALTGYGQPQDKERARAAGFDFHVAKPADPQAILAMLAKVTQSP
ncbi:MAG: ATP-binding protein [Pseudomonadota bacterium]